MYTYIFRVRHVSNIRENTVKTFINKRCIKFSFIWNTRAYCCVYKCRNCCNLLSFAKSSGTFTAVDCVWNVMAHAQKPDFVFRRKGWGHLNRRDWGGRGGVSSVDCWQPSCAHQPAGFVLLVRACVLQSCDAYWLPTPFASFPLRFPGPCVTMCYRISTGLYRYLQYTDDLHFTLSNIYPWIQKGSSKEFFFSNLC